MSEIKENDELTSNFSFQENIDENKLTENEKIEIKDLMEKLEDKLDGEIGNMWWKVYIASAFWSNVSTPINLAITLLSAVTAGQATTDNMLNKNTFIKVSVASLLISTLNTFFRPHTQYINNMDILKKVNEFGFEFENIHYSKKSDSKDYLRRYNAYKKLMIKFHRYKNTLSPDQQNFLTDLIYYICIKSCLRNDDKWLDIDKKYIDYNDEEEDKDEKEKKDEKGKKEKEGEKEKKEDELDVELGK